MSAAVVLYDVFSFLVSGLRGISVRSTHFAFLRIAFIRLCYCYLFISLFLTCPSSLCSVFYFVLCCVRAFSAPGHRLAACPHFYEGCSGCKFLHLDSRNQWEAKQHMLRLLLQQLLKEQQEHQNNAATPSCVDIKPLIATHAETGYAYKAKHFIGSATTNCRKRN